MPFTSVEELYLKTNFRLALMPSSSNEDIFKYSPNPLWRKVYEERIEPHLEEYASHASTPADLVFFIRDDSNTAAYGGYKPFT